LDDEPPDDALVPPLAASGKQKFSRHMSPLLQVRLG
jgi:hypothetical protein